jgi:hypothetical protein
MPEKLPVREQINTLKNRAFLNITMLWTSHFALITREMHCPNEPVLRPGLPHGKDRV